jgi:hypothetical protein
MSLIVGESFATDGKIVRTELLGNEGPSSRVALAMSVYCRGRQSEFPYVGSQFCEGD